MVALAIDLGRFHPLLVHLPIGILTMAFLLEIYSRKKNSVVTTDIAQFVLALAAISSLLSVGSGWLLGENGGYDETLLFRHRWLAVAMTVGTVILYLLKKSSATLAAKLYLPLFIVVLILLSITGHLGGSMTHGEDYLFADISQKDIVITDVTKAKVYQDIVQPILNNKCVSCHNKSKIKGGLLMTAKEELLLGGDSGSIFDSVAESPARLIQRLHLPLTDEEHMPPKGKVQPTADEILILEWWIANQNCFDCLVSDLDKTEKLDEILYALEEDTSPRALIAKEVDPVPQDWIASMNETGISVQALAEESPLLFVNMSGRKEFGKTELKALKKYASNIVELNLSNSNFNDTISTQLSSFKNLTKIQLQNTQITDKTLKNLENLTFLESLNLYGTKITDAAFSSIEKMKALKNIYLWQTDVSPEKMEQYVAERPMVMVQGQIDDELFAASSLEPPMIIASTDFFKDTLSVSLAYVFDDVSLYYTIDGSQPDSTSIKYTEPLLLKESAHIKAITYKSGWGQSDVSQAHFKKSSIAYESVALNKAPHEKYTGHGAKTLIDLKRGSSNFVDGNWLGYESSHFMATLNLKEVQEISMVSVHAMSAPVSWIFFPNGFEVYTSMDGKEFTQVKKVKLPPQEPILDVEFNFFDLAIPPTKAKYVRVGIKSPLKNPSWHPEPGGNSFIFIDEIVLN